MNTLAMTLLVKDYERAKKTIAWFREYDGGDKSDQIHINVGVHASSTAGATEAVETLRIVKDVFATGMREQAISWSEKVIGEFPDKMRALVDEG